MKSVQHDIAFLAATETAARFRNVLRPEEYRDAFELLYQRFKQALNEYDSVIQQRIARGVHTNQL